MQTTIPFPYSDMGSVPVRKVLGYFNIFFYLAAFVVMQTTIPSPYSDMGIVHIGKVLGYF